MCLTKLPQKGVNRGILVYCNVFSLLGLYSFMQSDQIDKKNYLFYLCCFFLRSIYTSNSIKLSWCDSRSPELLLSGAAKQNAWRRRNTTLNLLSQTVASEWRDIRRPAAVESLCPHTDQLQFCPWLVSLAGVAAHSSCWRSDWLSPSVYSLDWGALKPSRAFQTKTVCSQSVSWPCRHYGGGKVIICHVLFFVLCVYERFVLWRSKIVWHYFW